MGHLPVVPGPLLEEVSDTSSSNLLSHTNAADNGKLYSHLFSLAKTPIKFDKLEQELQNYNREDAEKLKNGFRYGFPLHYTGNRLPVDAINLKSARARPSILKEKILAEIEAGRVAGPFDERPFPSLRVLHWAWSPKKNPADFRLIHHLSYPPGNSLNDFIDPSLCTVQYTSFDMAVHMVQDLGQSCLLGKSDLKSAFRNLPVSPVDFDQLGFKFEGKFYFDKPMLFGCSISCSTFECFAKFLEYCVKQHAGHGRGSILHYLDDFLFGGKRGTNQCLNIMSTFKCTMSDLGVPVAEDKTEGPTTKICFLGLEIDSEEMVIRIPMSSIIEIREKIASVLSKEKVTLKKMQSLTGVNFACPAVISGRPFCRRLINSICGLTKPFHHLRITAGVRKDLLMWLQFFQEFNGVSVFHDRYWVSKRGRSAVHR